MKLPAFIVAVLCAAQISSGSHVQAEPKPVTVGALPARALAEAYPSDKKDEKPDVPKPGEKIVEKNVVDPKAADKAADKDAKDAKPADKDDKKDAIAAPLTTLAPPSGADQKKGNPRAGIFLASEKIRQNLIICNAFASQKTLDVDLISDAPDPLLRFMGFKSCRRTRAPVKAGDELRMELFEVDIGRYIFSAMPNNKATLLIVVQRKDALTEDAVFSAHVFYRLASPQLAVIDAYLGPEQAELRIQDSLDPEIPRRRALIMKVQRSERLEFGKAFAIRTGLYQLVLYDKEGPNAYAGTGAEVDVTDKVPKGVLLEGGAEPAEERVDKSENGIRDNAEGGVDFSNVAVLEERSFYVAIRTGCVGKPGRQFPQEIFVWPKPPKERLTPRVVGAGERPNMFMGILMVTCSLGFLACFIFNFFR